MNCPNCGTQLPNESTICPQCQNVINAESVANHTNTEEPASVVEIAPTEKIKSKKKRNIIIAVVTAVVVILALIVFGILVSTHVICLNHDWKAATCMEPETCRKCGKVRGEISSHTEGEWVVAKAPTLTEKGAEELLCSLCGNAVDNREIDAKIPKTDGECFNFTDEEFIDWVNDTFDYHVEALDFSDDDDVNTKYYTQFEDETGIFSFNHGEYGKDGNVHAIIVYFDEWTTAAAVAAIIGDRMDSKFSADEAIYPLVLTGFYTGGDLTEVIIDIDDDSKAAILAPRDVVQEIIS